jgi:hypothetical protein
MLILGPPLAGIRWHPIDQAADLAACLTVDFLERLVATPGLTQELEYGRILGLLGLADAAQTVALECLDQVVERRTCNRLHSEGRIKAVRDLDAL